MAVCGLGGLSEVATDEQRMRKNSPHEACGHGRENFPGTGDGMGTVPAAGNGST